MVPPAAVERRRIEQFGRRSVRFGPTFPSHWGNERLGVALLGLLQASMRIDGERVGHASDELLQLEFESVRDELVDNAELAKAKKQKAVEWLFDRQTVLQSADSLGRGFLAAADPLLDRAYAQNIQKVTAGQFRRGCPPLVRPEQFDRVTVAPPHAASQAAAKTPAAAAGKVRFERIAQRPAGAGGSGTPTCPWSTSRPSCWAGRWWTTKRPPDGPTWSPTCSTRGPPSTRPSSSPTTSTRSAGGCPSAPAASASSAT